jgi:2,3-bisphosphoglycerate-dependent phosphoglycerate mutase
MTDTPLTDDGILEARAAGRLLAVQGIQFDLVFTSLLRRSTKTVWLVMQELALEWVPVIKDWRLNERNYGSLVGLHKKESVEKFGKDQVKRWRRSWDEPPPPMTKDSIHWPGNDSRYKALGIDVNEIPPSESLKEVTERTSKFWDEMIVPQLKQGKRLLIVGHENNLRSILKRLDNISNDQIINLELPRGIPLVYKLDPITLAPIKVKDSADMLSGKYLSDKDYIEEIASRDFKQVIL